jgi:hypothetical protein
MDERDHPPMPPVGTTRCYEVRVRTHVASAQASSLAHHVHGTTVPRHTVRRLVLVRDAEHPVDLPAVLKRLTECDVDVLDVRLSRLPHQPTDPEGPA